MPVSQAQPQHRAVTDASMSGPVPRSGDSCTESDAMRTRTRGMASERNSVSRPLVPIVGKPAFVCEGAAQNKNTG